MNAPAVAESEIRTASPPRLWQRRRFWAWLFFGFIASLVLFVFLLPSTRTFVQFHRVKQGMTPQEIVGLLGPPNTQTDGRNAVDEELFEGQMVWISGEMTYFVRFSGGVAVHKSMHSFEKGLRWVLGSRISRNLF